MIAQWDGSLSVLSVARIMIAQWDSSLSVLPVARVMIAQWDSSLSVLLAHNSGSIKERGGTPLENCLHPHEKIMRCLRISLVHDNNNNKTQPTIAHAVSDDLHCT